MKVSYALFLAWFCVCVGNADAAHVYFNLQNFTAQSVSNKTFKIAPASMPSTSGGAIIVREPFTTNTGSGTFYISNVVAGNYDCTVSTPILPTTFRIPVPDTNGVVYAYQLYTNGLSAVILTNLYLGNTLWVDRANGNDLSASRNDMVRRFQSIGAAKTNALSGDLVMVLPGTYNEYNLAKSNISYYFHSGSTVSNVAASTGTAYGIFDDRAPGAAGPMEVSGFGTFIFRGCNPVNTTANGPIVMTNATSQWRIRGRNVYFSTRNTDAGFAGIWVENCKPSHFAFDEICDTFEQWSDLGDIDPENPQFSSSGAEGIHWQAGDMYVDCRRLVVDGNYGIWSKGLATSTTNSLYCKGQFLASSNGVALYVNSNTAGGVPGFRTWVEVLEIFGTISTLGDVKCYVTAQKIGAAGIAIEATGELWLTAQKVSSPYQWVNKTTHNGGQQRPAHINVQQFEDTGNTIGNSVPAISNDSTNDLFIHGGYMKGGTNTGFLVKHFGQGRTRLIGVTVDGSANANTNAPITVSSNGLILEATTILASSTAASAIHAPTAQIVDMRGVTIPLKAIHSNITQSNGWAQASGAVSSANPVQLLIGGNAYPATYLLWSQDSDGSNTNVINTLTSIFGTGIIGSKTLPPNFWRHGRNVVVEVEGQFWQSTGNWIVNLSLGSTVINTANASPVVNAAGDQFTGRFVLNCRTNASGTNIQSVGRLTFGTSTRFTFTNTLTLLTTPDASAAIDIQSTNATTQCSFLCRNARFFLTP